MFRNSKALYLFYQIRYGLLSRIVEQESLLFWKCGSVKLNISPRTSDVFLIWTFIAGYNFFPHTSYLLELVIVSFSPTWTFFDFVHGYFQHYPVCARNQKYSVILNAKVLMSPGSGVVLCFPNEEWNFHYPVCICLYNCRSSLNCVSLFRNSCFTQEALCYLLQGLDDMFDSSVVVHNNCGRLWRHHPSFLQIIKFHPE